MSVHSEGNQISAHEVYRVLFEKLVGAHSKRNVLISEDYFQLLPPHSVSVWPIVVILPGTRHMHIIWLASCYHSEQQQNVRLCKITVFRKAHFIISASCTIRFNSPRTTSLQKTANQQSSRQTGCSMNCTFLADHGVVFIVGVVGVTQFAIRPELELKKLVPELTLVAHAASRACQAVNGLTSQRSLVSKVELFVRHW